MTTIRCTSVAVREDAVAKPASRLARLLMVHSDETQQDFYWQNRADNTSERVTKARVHALAACIRKSNTAVPSWATRAMVIELPPVPRREASW